MAVFTKTLEERTGSLTKSQIGIAGFISGNKAEAAFLTLEEFAAKAGVPMNTIRMSFIPIPPGDTIIIAFFRVLW